MDVDFQNLLSGLASPDNAIRNAAEKQYFAAVSQSASNVLRQLLTGLKCPAAEARAPSFFLMLHFRRVLESGSVSVGEMIHHQLLPGLCH